MSRTTAGDRPLLVERLTGCAGSSRDTAFMSPHPAGVGFLGLPAALSHSKGTSNKLTPGRKPSRLAGSPTAGDAGKVVSSVCGRCSIGVTGHLLTSSQKKKKKKHPIDSGYRPELQRKDYPAKISVWLLVFHFPVAVSGEM